MASPRALFTSPVRRSPAWARVVGGRLFAVTHSLNGWDQEQD